MEEFTAGKKSPVYTEGSLYPDGLLTVYLPLRHGSLLHVVNVYGKPFNALGAPKWYTWTPTLSLLAREALIN